MTRPTSYRHLHGCTVRLRQSPMYRGVIMDSIAGVISVLWKGKHPTSQWQARVHPRRDLILVHIEEDKLKVTFTDQNEILLVDKIPVDGAII